MPLCKAHLSYATGPRLPGPLQPPGSTHIWADHAYGEGQQLFRLKGDVAIGRDDQAVSADAATYYKDAQRADVKGDVHLRQGDLTAQGSQGYFNLKAYAGRLDDAKYQYDLNRAHGRARHVIVENQDVTRLQDATLTTCDPDDVVWYLKSSSVTLNRATGRGHAFNVIFHFKDVPVFYFPYISFPISHKRKSGFLIPSFHSSSRSGLMFSFPYYLNLAPNYDATLTPTYMSRRGLQYQGEFRYLTRANHGLADVQFLPGDRVYGGNRAHVVFQNRGVLTPHLGTDLAVDYVTDKEYLKDFGAGLSTISTPYLDNHLDLTYRWRNGYATGRLQAYEAVDTAIPASVRPYQLLPELLFDYNPVITGGMFDQVYNLGGQFIHFSRPGAATVSRLDVSPSVSLPFQREAGFFIPKLTLHYSDYRLSGQGSGVPSNLTRTLPVTSVDTGVYLERGVDWGSHHWLQTLEPRLFYLYIPYVDQSQLPILDTGLPTLNMSLMYSDNRFNGIDRIGDTNRLTAGLTTRFLRRDNGQELLRASVGQMLFFSDRRVTLPGQPVQTGNTSNLVAEAAAALNQNLSTNADLIWDRNTHRLDKGTVQVRYKRDNSHIINLAYRYWTQTVFLRQADVSMVWPLYRHWRFVGRWNYSFRQKRNLETLAGVEYSSCCWGFQLVWRQFVSGINGGSNRYWMFQLMLNGLTSIGNPVESVLEQGILGYATTP